MILIYDIKTHINYWYKWFFCKTFSWTKGIFIVGLKFNRWCTFGT